MRLLNYGGGVQNQNWRVVETAPPRYSRVYWIHSGAVKYADSRGEEALKAGALYVFPSCIPFEIRHEPCRPLECTWFHLDVFPLQVDRLLRVTLTQRAAGLMALIQAEVGKGRPNTYYLSLLTEAFYQALLIEGVFSPPDAFAERVTALIQETSGEQIDLEELGQRVGYSKGHLIRCFKHITGVTPHQYLISYRMNKALLLLKDQQPIEAIAEQTGYANGKSFANAFKKYFGVAPQHYKLYLA